MESVSNSDSDKPSQPESAGDGGLSQDDIDALLSGAESGAAESADQARPAPKAASTSADSGIVSQDDIDALFAGAAVSSGGPADVNTSVNVPPKAAPTTESAELSQDDIDALLNASGDAGAGAAAESASTVTEPDTRLDTSGRPFDEAAAAMAAAIAEEQAAARNAPTRSAPMPDLQPLELSEFGGSAVASNDLKRVTMLNDVNLHVRLQLGRTRMLIEDVLRLGEGSLVELDKLAGDPVDVLVNDRLVARGEVLVLNDNFCVRVCEVLSNDPHRVTT
ncbi:MAG: flagellar motor switch protein FliN [Planctomycetes bacterium]|nr:flagellar motor switch protein FliN [Planctomycetota bacterium]